MTRRVYSYLTIGAKHPVITIFQFPSGIKTTDVTVLRQGPLIPKNGKMGIITLLLILGQLVHGIDSCQRIFVSDFTRQLCTYQGIHDHSCMNHGYQRIAMRGPSKSKVFPSFQEKGPLLRIKKGKPLIEIHLAGICFHLAEIGIYSTIKNQMGSKTIFGG